MPTWNVGMRQEDLQIGRLLEDVLSWLQEDLFCLQRKHAGVLVCKRMSARRNIDVTCCAQHPIQLQW